MEAVAKVQSVLDYLHVPYIVACNEAEHIMVKIQQEEALRGLRTYILSVDSDFLVLGATDLLISTQLWSGCVRYWKGPELLRDEALLRRLHNLGQQNVRTKAYLRILAIILERFSLEGLRCLCYHLPNDYCQLKGSTVKRLLDGVDEKMIRSCRLPSDLMGLLSTAAVQHERVAAEQDLPSIKRQVEAAMIMFSCAAVLDSSRRTVGALTPPASPTVSLRRRCPEVDWHRCLGRAIGG